MIFSEARVAAEHLTPHVSTCDRRRMPDVLVPLSSADRHLLLLLAALPRLDVTSDGARIPRALLDRLGDLAQRVLEALG